MIMHQIEINSQFSHAFKCFFKHKSVKRQKMERKGISQKLYSTWIHHVFSMIQTSYNYITAQTSNDYYCISPLKSQNEKTGYKIHISS